MEGESEGRCEALGEAITIIQVTACVCLNRTASRGQRKGEKEGCSIGTFTWEGSRRFGFL